MVRGLRSGEERKDRKQHSLDVPGPLLALYMPAHPGAPFAGEKTASVARFGDYMIRIKLLEFGYKVMKLVFEFGASCPGANPSLPPRGQS